MTAKKLSKNDNIIIMKQDKGRGMFIMGKPKCHENF